MLEIFFFGTIQVHHKTVMMCDPAWTVTAVLPVDQFFRRCSVVALFSSFGLLYTETVRRNCNSSHGGGRGGGEGVRRRKRRQRDDDYNNYADNGNGNRQDRRRVYTFRRGTQTQERFDRRVWGGGDDHELDSASQKEEFCIMTDIDNDKVVEAS